MESTNPTTGQRIQTWTPHDAFEVRRRLDAAAAAFLNWRTTPFATRSAILRNVASVLRSDRDVLARRMVLEVGKPLGAAEAEVEKCAWVCEFYAEHAEAFLAPDPVTTDATDSFVRFDPIGPVLGVMPWNFPLWQVFRFAAPALMAGNVGLLKHASNVCGCALDVEDAFRRGGLPAGAFQVLLIPAGSVDAVIRDPVVRAVTLTGSDLAGRRVASAAGEALKKSVLELGGSDPFIVLADADPVAVAAEAAKARCVNSGQSCIAAKRFLVEEPIANRFEAALVDAMARLRVGDPADRATDVGPLARRDLVDDLHSQVTRSIAAGAVLRTGGRPIEGPGFFYPPTVLSGVVPGMPAFDEETFGPLAPVTRVRDADHAVELANRSRFGLGASLWTRPDRGRELAPRIEAGCVFVNGLVKSDPRLPFGGIKDSGWGRELAAFGIREFVNAKTVWVK